MDKNKYLEEFGKPFPKDDVKWRLQNVDEQKSVGRAVPYLDARAIADRLDSVIGQNRWRDDYREWRGIDKNGKQIYAQLCTIYIYDEELGEWIGKTDGAENTDREPIKGGLSDAFKRAAVKWNIGRYLYQFNAEKVSVKKWGKNFYITDDAQAELDRIYADTVAEIFGKDAGEVKQKPPASKKPPEAKEVPIFEINAVETQADKSALIFSRNGTKYKAYMQGVDKRLQNGTRITNVRMRRRKTSIGECNILTSYDIAA